MENGVKNLKGARLFSETVCTNGMENPFSIADFWIYLFFSNRINSREENNSSHRENFVSASCFLGIDEKNSLFYSSCLILRLYILFIFKKP